MDQLMKDRLIEEGKQRAFVEILDKAANSDAITMKDEVLAVGIIEAGTLRGLIEHIFEKALDDPTVHQQLAELCQAMPAHFDPPAEHQPKEKGAGSRSASEKRIDFRLMVLKRAKEELEKGTATVKACKAWDSKEGAKTSIKGDDKKQMEDDRAARARLMVSIHFLGCLYNAGMVGEKVIHSILDLLMKDEEAPESSDMEALSSLLKLIGPKFDSHAHTTKEGKVVGKYFDKLTKMQENAVSKQVAELINGIMNMRSKNWEQ